MFQVQWLILLLALHFIATNNWSHHARVRRWGNEFTAFQPDFWSINYQFFNYGKLFPQHSKADNSLSTHISSFTQWTGEVNWLTPCTQGILTPCCTGRTFKHFSAGISGRFQKWKTLFLLYSCILHCVPDPFWIDCYLSNTTRCRWIWYWQGYFPLAAYTGSEDLVRKSKSYVFMRHWPRLLANGFFVPSHSQD